jgi:hypothetical protein
MVGAKKNDMSLLFAPTNICPLRCLDGGVNVDVDERKSGTHYKFVPICYLLGANGIRGAPHLPHMFGTLGVN